MNQFTIYRFHDTVAIHAPDDTRTMYLSSKEAKRLARALYRVARDIGDCAFVDSDLGMLKAELIGPRAITDPRVHSS